MTELSLLFHGSRLSIALGNNNAAKSVAEFAGHFLISGFANVITETYFRIRIRWGKEDAPSIIRHLNVIEMRPSFGFDTDGGTKVDIFSLKAVRTHFAPPVQIIRQPFFQSSLQALVIRKIHVIWYSVV